MVSKDYLNLLSEIKEKRGQVFAFSMLEKADAEIGNCEIRNRSHRKSTHY